MGFSSFALDTTITAARTSLRVIADVVAVLDSTTVVGRTIITLNSSYDSSLFFLLNKHVTARCISSLNVFY